MQKKGFVFEYKPGLVHIGLESIFMKLKEERISSISVFFQWYEVNTNTLSQV